MPVTPVTPDISVPCPWLGRCIPGVNCSGRGDCRLRNNTDKVNTMADQVADLHRLMGNGTMQELIDVARASKAIGRWTYRAVVSLGVLAGALTAIVVFLDFLE